MICFIDNTKKNQAVSQAQLFEEEPNPKEAFREIRNYLRYSCPTLKVWNGARHCWLAYGRWGWVLWSCMMWCSRTAKYPRASSGEVEP
jgi:hypothetical protein